MAEYQSWRGAPAKLPNDVRREKTSSWLSRDIRSQVGSTRASSIDAVVNDLGVPM